VSVHGSRLRCSPPTKLGHTAVAKITDDLEQLLAFYDYPAEHWRFAGGRRSLH